MMMVKEHFIEEFGAPRWTIGSGRSGGSMQQHLIANNYPGLLDGLIPTAAFADTITFMNHLFDCELLDHAFKTSSLMWTDEQKAAVAGEANWQYCAKNGTALSAACASNNCDRMAVPADLVYDPKTNPKGARCTYQDNMVNVFGRDPKTGFAASSVRQRRHPVRTEGAERRQDHVRAVRRSQSRAIGGHDIDGNVVSARTVADPEALRIAYQTGRVNDTSKGMAMVPMIDVRPYTEGTGDVHDTVNSQITRARSSRPTARRPTRCCTPTSRARRFSVCSASISTRWSSGWPASRRTPRRRRISWRRSSATGRLA